MRMLNDVPLNPMPWPKTLKPLAAQILSFPDPAGRLGPIGKRRCAPALAGSAGSCCIVLCYTLIVSYTDGRTAAPPSSCRPVKEKRAEGKPAASAGVR